MLQSIQEVPNLIRSGRQQQALEERQAVLVERIYKDDKELEIIQLI